MKITILGSGSKGNSTLIEIENIKILIDVGFSYRVLKEKLNSINVNPSDINYILITHDHSDHIFGLSTFLKIYKPIVYMSPKIAEIYFNEDYDSLKYFEPKFKINDINITLIPTSHDATDSDGFLIEYKGVSLVYITDTGYIPSRLLNEIKNKNYYIIESNHDIDMLINGSYPPYLQKRILGDSGHLSNDLCGVYLSKIIGNKTKKIILAHLSEENNSASIALNTVNDKLKDNENLCEVCCATQNEILEVIND